MGTKSRKGYFEDLTSRIICLCFQKEIGTHVFQRKIIFILEENKKAKAKFYFFKCVICFYLYRDGKSDNFCSEDKDFKNSEIAEVPNLILEKSIVVNALEFNLETQSS